MNNVVTRSLWLLAISTAIVLLSLAFFPPQASPHEAGEHAQPQLEEPGGHPGH